MYTPFAFPADSEKSYSINTRKIEHRQMIPKKYNIFEYICRLSPALFRVWHPGVFFRL